MNHQKRFREEIIIFTRYPQAGVTKTRLIPELGADGAAAIHRSMSERIVRTAMRIVGEPGPRLTIYYTGGSHQLMRKWLGPALSYHEQTGADLGQKMMFAFRDAWQRGAKRAILIGTDCPSLDSGLITDALATLQNSLLVLGPATDGGYYLIGTTNGLPADTLSGLFRNIAWGTSNVFQETVARAGKAGLTPSILTELHDIDHPGDLAYFHHHPDPQ